jgi:hypothetical protein
MKYWKPEEIRARIDQILGPGSIVTRHNSRGHFYEVREGEERTADVEKVVGPVYPSVTGRLQILKDEGLINYKMNRAIEYFKNFVFTNYNKLNDANVMEMIEEAANLASRVSQDVLMDAGDVGTRIHNVREDIFNHWIKTEERPKDFLAFIPPDDPDVRVISAIRALQKFCEDKDYIPVKCELLVYSHKLKTAGTLDDLGLMRKVIREGEGFCGDGFHNILSHPYNGTHRCVACGYKYRYEFVLMDLKTSNQFKDHYFFQVALYWWKLWNLLGKAWKPERCFILKVSKEDGSYKIEDIKYPGKLANYAMAMLKTNEAVDFIKEIRKDNQKTVAPIMKL